MVCKRKRSRVGPTGYFASQPRRGGKGRRCCSLALRNCCRQTVLYIQVASKLQLCIFIMCGPSRLRYAPAGTPKSHRRSCMTKKALRVPGFMLMVLDAEHCLRLGTQCCCWPALVARLRLATAAWCLSGARLSKTRGQWECRNCALTTSRCHARCDLSHPREAPPRKADSASQRTAPASQRCQPCTREARSLQLLQLFGPRNPVLSRSAGAGGAGGRGGRRATRPQPHDRCGHHSSRKSTVATCQGPCPRTPREKSAGASRRAPRARKG
jgi:hypothetical protein